MTSKFYKVSTALKLPRVASSWVLNPTANKTSSIICNLCGLAVLSDSFYDIANCYLVSVRKVGCFADYAVYVDALLVPPCPVQLV